MRNPPLRLQLTVLGFAAVALLALAAAAARVPVDMNRSQGLLAVLLFGLIFLAQVFPVHLAPKIKITVDTAPMFAATLLLPAPVAMGIAAAAGVAGATARGVSWRQATFTMAESALRVAVGALAFHLLAGSRLLTNLEPGAWLYAVPIAAAAMYAANEVMVDIVVAVQVRRSPLGDFWRRRQFDLPQEGALYLLGLLVAAIATDYPWAVALLAVPSLVVYRSLRDGTALRAQTREALEELADIVDMRDHYTFEHSRRVAALARATAEMLGLPAEEIERIEMAGRVHDVGKIGIKSTVLLNPESLSDPQWAEMRRHPEVGARLVAKFPQFSRGREIVLAHHERWDGRGYPRGLSGEGIPFGARVLAVADAWDAMTSHRAYRRALDLQRVNEEMKRGRSTQFDPVVLDAFLKVLATRPELVMRHIRESQDVDAPLPQPAPA